jgi:hypothetical protein
MNNRALSLMITVASLGALCAPVMAAKTAVPGKTTETSVKTSCAKKAHKGACKNVAKSAPVKSAQ